MAGQTINDRLLAARHSIAGQGLAKSVCKATTEEMIAPKKKHLDCEYCFSLTYPFTGMTPPNPSAVKPHRSPCDGVTLRIVDIFTTLAS